MSIQDFPTDVKQTRSPSECLKTTGVLATCRRIPPSYSDMTVSSYPKFVARIKGVPKSGVRPALDATLEKCSLEKVTKRVGSSTVYTIDSISYNQINKTASDFLDRG